MWDRPGHSYGRGVTPSDRAALLALPVVYALALALRDAGIAADDIADRLEVPRESMPALLEIAEAKLDAARNL